MMTKLDYFRKKVILTLEKSMGIIHYIKRVKETMLSS